MDELTPLSGPDTVSVRIAHYTGCHSNTLVADHWGDARDPTVLLLHGGGQTRFAWRGTAGALSRAGYFVVSLDLRGHGESDWVPTGDYSYDAFCDDVVRVIEAVGGTPTIVGASLGGIAGLLAAGEASGDIASALILVDIAPRMEPEGVQRISAFMDAHPTGFESLDEAGDAIADYQPGRRRPDDTSGLAKNLRLGEDGRWRWHWDPRFLAAAKAGISHGGIEGRLQHAAAKIAVPTLLVRGAMSDVLSDQGANEFQALVPHASYVDVRSAGHMVVGDRNDLFTDAVVSFLCNTVPSHGG